MQKSRIPYEQYARFPDLMCKIVHRAALTLLLGMYCKGRGNTII